MIEAETEEHDRLSEAISSWVRRRRNSSLGLLAKLSGVPYPTVRRVAQREFRPTLQNALQIASVVVPSDQVIDILSEGYSDSVELLRELFKVSAPAKVDEDVLGNSILQSKEDFWVFSQALKKSGIALKAIESRFGSEGLKSLDKLVSLRLIRQFGENCKTASADMSFGSIFPTLSSIKFLVDLFDFEDMENRGGTCAGARIEELSEQGISKVNDALFRANQEIQLILEDEANRGEQVFCVGIVATRLNGG